MANKIYFWGNNHHNLLSSSSTRSFPKPQNTKINLNIKDISASEKHISLIANDGNVYSYGINLDGRLGIGAKPDAKYTLANPAKVKLPARAVTIKCGFSHVCVQLSND